MNTISDLPEISLNPPSYDPKVHKDTSSLSWLALSLVSGLGPKTLHDLGAKLSSVQQILYSSVQELVAFGLDSVVTQEISGARKRSSFFIEFRLLEDFLSTTLLLA